MQIVEIQGAFTMPNKIRPEVSRNNFDKIKIISKVPSASFDDCLSIVISKFPKEKSR